MTPFHPAQVPGLRGWTWAVARFTADEVIALTHNLTHFPNQPERWRMMQNVAVRSRTLAAGWLGDITDAVTDQLARAACRTADDAINGVVLQCERPLPPRVRELFTPVAMASRFAPLLWDDLAAPVPLDPNGQTESGAA